MTREEKIVQFWIWFQQHNHFSKIPQQEETYFYMALGEKLEKIDENLVYEINPLQQGVQKMIISIKGNYQNTITCATVFIEKSPTLKGWSFTLSDTN